MALARVFCQKEITYYLLNLLQFYWCHLTNLFVICRNSFHYGIANSKSLAIIIQFYVFFIHWHNLHWHQQNLFQNLYYLNFVIQQLLPASLPNFKSFENLGHIDLLIQSIYTEHVALLSDFLSFIICRRQQLQVVEWGSITDLHLLRTILAIRQKLQPSHFWELIDSFVLLAYVSLAASKNLLKRLLACLHITLDSEYLLKMVNSQLVSINCSNSRKNNCHWK